ncbi:MAG: hypothetical protein Q7S43_05190 [bacterium]|nr:hypothetical protein [bacterium]
MNQQEFERIEKIFKKYREFIFSLPGIMGAGYSDRQISIDIKPEKVELVRQFVATSIEGIPVKIRPRTELPIFFHCSHYD